MSVFNFDALCTLYVYSISKVLFDIEYHIVLQYPGDITISKVKTLMSYNDVHDIGAMSGYKDIDIFSWISKIWSM